MVSYKYNQHWKESACPKVSVITPFYNRGYCLNRAFQSVNAQTYRDFEYIIVDDGSIENNDPIVEAFMSDVAFPVMYIKKQNGGVHTARNMGIKHSRGEYIVCLDSDDELVPEALQMMTDIWLDIPEEERDEYFEVKFRCKDQDGKCVSMAFPEDLNTIPYKERIKLYENITGEYMGVRRGDIMRANPWPEPAGIKFVSEGTLWRPLRRKYKSYFSNQIVRIYHTETEDSLIKQLNHKEGHTVQSLKNIHWNIAYNLNHRAMFYGIEKRRKWCIDTLRHSIFSHILFWKTGKYPCYLRGICNLLIHILLWIPTILPALYYMKKRVRA